MLKSEALSWPLTLALLVLAFGTLAAAGLPLLLTMAGLLGAGGLLFVSGQLLDVSIWAMNFAMMFAIALGIDYALFIVVRFRGALAEGLSPRDATVQTMATAGKAVLASGLTVIAALLAVMLVPVPTFRSVPLGIVLAVLSVLAATLTLLPAAAVRARSPHQRRPGAPAQRGRPSQRALRRLGPPAVGATAALRRRRARDPAPPRRARARTAHGMPTIAVVPHDADSREGHALLTRAFGEGAPSRAPGDARRARPAACRGRAGARSGHRGGHAPAARRRPCARDRRSPRPVRAATSCARRSTPCGPSCPPARWWAARPPRAATSSGRSSRGSRWWWA